MRGPLSPPNPGNPQAGLILVRPHIKSIMKRFLLVTAVLFITFAGCERHSAQELPPAKPVPSRSSGSEEAKEKAAWDKLIAYSTLAMAIFAVASIVVAVRAEGVFKQGLRTLSRMQIRAADAGMVRTMTTCIEQYQELENKLLHANEPGAITTDRYFELIWNLHFAEYHFFIRGFLPKEVYSLWILVRIQDYHANRKQSLLGKTEEGGWTHAKQYLIDKEFTDFVDSWITQTALTKPEIMKLLPPVNVARELEL